MRDHQDVTCWHQHGHPSFSRLFSPHTMAGGRMSSGSRGCQKRNCARAALRVPVAAETGGSARSALYVLAGSVSQAKTQRGEFANRGGRVSPVPAHPGVEHKLQFFSVCAQKRGSVAQCGAAPRCRWLVPRAGTTSARENFRRCADGHVLLPAPVHAKNRAAGADRSLGVDWCPEQSVN